METPAPGSKPGIELDRFKRRLIRTVARLLLKEKKPEEEIWTELKKETGHDCELLWTRMRALTLKKLDRLLLANDQMEKVPKPAQMSLTDWLMFDLVLVHQKIDLIGQNNPKKDYPVLVNVFELVKMFKLEFLSGEMLAEAWSLATLSYNNRGHQCSPMLLQRRWYQLKEVTRHQFYEYWYAYRGSQQRIALSNELRPSPLQTKIARYFKLLIIEPLESWEELIEKRKVVMPDEFDRKMKERVARRRPFAARKTSVDDGPDLVMIEPTVETIDLRLDPDDYATEDYQEELIPPVQPLVPLVKIKEEPLDDMDIDETQVHAPQKSIYEVVLESTDLENEQIDSMDTEDLDPESDYNEVEEVEDTPAREEEESVLPQIASVYGNVSDTSVLANIDVDRVYGNTENTEFSGNNDELNEVNVDHTYVDNDKNAGGDNETIVLDEDYSARGNKGDTDACEIVANVDDDGNERDTDACEILADESTDGNGGDTDACEFVADDSTDGNEGDTDACEIVADDSADGNERDTDACEFVAEDNDDGNKKGTEDCETVADENGSDNKKESAANVNIVDDSDQNNGRVTVLGNKDKGADISEEEVSDNVCATSPGGGHDITVSDDVNVISDDEDDYVSGNIAATLTSNLDETSKIAKVDETSVSGKVDETTLIEKVEKSSVSDNLDETSQIGKVDQTRVTGKVDATTVTGKVDESTVTGNEDETCVTGNLDETPVISKADQIGVTGYLDETRVTGNKEETCISRNVEDESELTVSKDVPVSNTQTNHPTVISALNAPTTTSTVIDSPSKDVEIIDIVSQPMVIIDSEDEDIPMVDDLFKNVTNSTIKDIIVPINTVDEPMEVDSTPEAIEIFSAETLKVGSKGDAVIPQDVEISSPETLKVGLKVDTAIHGDKKHTDGKQDKTSFNFGELPPDISFADEGIEFVDDGIVYVDEDENNELTIKSEDEETPKIDAKLLMCPIVYTTRLDDMYWFHRGPFYSVKDKTLLIGILKKSKPIKQEPKETVENVTINYAGESIESVTLNNLKTIEHVQENVSTIEKVSVNDDNIIIIKKEPVTVNNETIADVPIDNDDNVTSNLDDSDIKKEPVNVNSETIADVPIDNDDNVTFDDDDSDDNVIDESQKVKPTSYLLRKPRRRKYNPIQLCKNPDFNTRLKRLSVGFFSSPRNRVLIKSCKPLTIDLSKAFESKLVSGTLYLKPVDHNVVTKIIDDTESQSVSVLPSAMPAQSLIDNSKDADALPMLLQCLEASKQPVELPTTTKRNKVINLPDITEIRRINQRLLTAEVTPIQVHNSQPQVPVTIVAFPDTPTSTEQDLRSRVAEGTDARGPPKILDITEDSPARSSPGSHSTNSNKSHISTGRNTSDNLRPRLQGSIHGRPPRMLNGKRLFPPKPVWTVWKPRQVRPEVPWLTKNIEVSVNSMMKETLLTLDALNKMLFVLTDKQEPEELAKKPKPKVKRKDNALPMQRGRRKTNPDDDSVMPDPAKEDEASEKQKTHNTKNQKPKINIKAATNYPPDKTQKVPDNSKKKVKYCCWARQRMLQLLFNRQNIPPHGCSRLCACCCRHLLADYITSEKNVKSASEKELRARENPSCIQCGGKTSAYEALLCPNCSETKASVEKLVEPPPQVTVVESIPVVDTVPEHTPRVDVATNTEPDTDTTISENEPIAIEDTEDDVPTLGSEVYVQTTAEPVTTTAKPVKTATVAGTLEPRGYTAPVNVKRTLVAVPIVKAHNYISCEAGKPAYRNTRCLSTDKQTGGIILTATKSPSISSTGDFILNAKKTLSTSDPAITSAPSLSKCLTVKRSKTGTCRLKATKPPPPIFKKPFVPPKNFKEKMIFLNSKHISEKPTASPVFLGKNKILLTTVKFPPNLKLFQDTKKILRPTLNLPNGVHLILLTDGTISYKIDSNVEVDALEMAKMPAIMETLREHMYLHAAQEEVKRIQMGVPAPSAAASEVVDLVEDDDDSVSEVQTIKESFSINSEDSLDVSHNSKVDTSKVAAENLADKNINSNVIDAEIESNQSETESNQIESESYQKETADQNCVTDIQEDIQESSKKEIVLASTEQVQPDPSIQKISAEIDDQLKPSSQTECTHVHDVTVVQGQSEPSGKYTRIEAQEHVEPAIQNITTGVLDESKSGPIKPKTKNILSDLMEMSGIFDEDMIPETLPAQPIQQVTLAQDTSLLVPEVHEPPAQQVVEPPAQEVVKLPFPAGISIIRPIPSASNPAPPKLSSPLGELTPITSLYELKYACANKGVFFKLDFETGYLVPINVCMKPTVQKPVQPPATISVNIAPKSVIDLTDDDDKQDEQKDTEQVISPTKRSLLLVNNSPSGSFTGPVKPVKLFKALKPNILQQLNLNKTKSVKVLGDRSTMQHTMKRKQFLKNINMNADLSVIRLKRPHVRRIKDAAEAVIDPNPTISSSQPAEESVTTILSDDDSDDEPLAKIAKRKRENENASEENRNTSESITEDTGQEPQAADEEPEISTSQQQIEIELPAADNEDYLEDPEAPEDETVYMSEDENFLMDEEETFEFDPNDGNEEEEDCCILGV